jgi:hypothetical protein
MINLKTAKASIAINVPGVEKSNRYFSFYLKKNISNERDTYLTFPKRIFVVSGSINSFSDFCKLLANNKVIDRYLNWKFDDGHLVILGNCLGQVNEMIEWCWFIYSLEEQALQKGGYIHLVGGGKVLANLNSDWRYMHPKYAQKKPGSKKSVSALFHGNSEIWRWLSSKNDVEKIGPFLFVAGGISPALNAFSCNISQINAIARSLRENRARYNDSAIKQNFNSDDSPDK